MARSAILTLRDATIGFGGPPLFAELDITIQEHDRISLVGRNGVGKTSLMLCLAGKITPDAGERWVQPGTTTAMLLQDYAPHGHTHSIDAVMDGLPQEEQGVIHQYRAEKILEALGLPKDVSISGLSGGQIRRLGLARTLVQDAEILLLDEPTNHLDLQALLWLEDYLRDYRGAVVTISHDRRFLENISNKVLWLEKKRVHQCPYGYAKFPEWQDAFYQTQISALRKQQRALEREELWAHQGVTARRKRNERRVKMLQNARAKLRENALQIKKRIAVNAPEKDSDKRRELVEFIKVNKSYDAGKKVITRDLSLKIVRGDRIGILGANGSGKTSFLRLAIGEEQGDSGKIKRPRTLEFSYFDQNRR
ncbi:MAG: ATP-binding cassette domain-containing protein, partial [Pseudomonadota bacterium]